MTFWIGLIIGLVVGGCIGLLTFALLSANKEDDDAKKN